MTGSSKSTSPSPTEASSRRVYSRKPSFSAPSLRLATLPSSTDSTTQYVPSTTAAELVIAEGHYLSTLKRVGNALNLASSHVSSTGKKGSNTIRALVERWALMLHIHSKFHDEIAAVKEDVNEIARMVNDLFLTLEPILVEHGRDMSNAVYKLNRAEKRVGQIPAEWDAALRHPFDHLAIYNEWLQRIDPEGLFNKEALAQLNMLARNVKTVIDANQNPRSMLKRISTFARGVIRRPSSGQVLSLDSATGLATPSPRTTDISTPSTALTTSSSDLLLTSTLTQPPSATGSIFGRLNLSLSQELVDSPTSVIENPIETVMGQVSSLKVADAALTLPNTTTSVSAAALTLAKDSGKMDEKKNKSSTNVSLNSNTGYGSVEPPVQSAQTSTSSTCSMTPITKAIPQRAASSDVSSVGSLTLAPSSESLLLKANRSATMPLPPRSVKSQRFLDSERERELRRATVRTGAQSIVAARAESLQNRPAFTARPSIDRLRSITNKDAPTKPPIKSLISFWEQTSESPIEA